VFYLHFSIFISYIHASSLSALSEVAGYDNVRILQGGFEEWKFKGGFDAHKSCQQTIKALIRK
jgi:3-mercaptopyruvate sulfurtransferase SseA